MNRKQGNLLMSPAVVKERCGRTRMWLTARSYHVQAIQRLFFQHGKTVSQLGGWWDARAERLIQPTPVPPLGAWVIRACNSKAECCIHIAEVVGALPTSPTIALGTKSILHLLLQQGRDRRHDQPFSAFNFMNRRHFLSGLIGLFVAPKVVPTLLATKAGIFSKLALFTHPTLCRVVT